MEPLIFIFILYIIYSLVVPGVALGRSKRAEQKAEDALRKAEDALRKAEQKAEDALHRLSKIQEGDLVAGELQPEKVVDSLIAEDLPPVAEIVSVRSMVTYPVSMAFTLWVREREKLSLHWARGQSPAVADGIQQRFTDPVPAGKKVITPASGSSGKKDPAHLPPVPAEGERRPAASAPTGRESGVEKPAAESIEMKLGTYWFVRIGVLLLLTGAGILAFYNRQFFIDLAPVAKVSCLYLLSGLLGGIGFWLQHTRETLRNYGQVLVAGGFSGVYFTTYAAHIFEPVKVIADPTVTLLLLLAWGGFMAWVANRLRSETVALFAVGAAYYATYVPLIHVNSGGVSHWVILASNVILAATAVAFMLRNRWFKMPLLSMSAAYAGFVLWRVRVEDPAPLLIVLLFAASLWIIYNAAVFLSRHDAFDDRKRAAFLTANNAALFGFLTWDVLRDHPQQFWILPLSFGMVLLGGALASRRLLGDQVLSCKSFLTQGLTLVTLGLMTTQLSESIKGPILAAETVVLLFMAIRRENRILKFAAIAVAAISFGFGIYDIDANSADYLKGCLAIASFLLFAGWLSHHRLEKDGKAILRPVVSYFSGLALAIGQLALFSSGLGGDMLPVILVGATLLLTASIYLIRVREFVLIGQVPALAGLCYSWLRIAEGESLTLPLPLLLVMIATLGLAHWWRWQRNHLTRDWVNRHSARMLPRWVEGVFSAGFIIQLLNWLGVVGDLQRQWLWIGPLLALAIMGYGALTRAAFLAALGQVFLYIGCFWSLSVFLPHIFIIHGDVDGGEIPMLLTLAPIGGLLLTASVIIAALRIGQAGALAVRLITGLQVCYQWAAAALGALWIYHFIPDAYRVLFAFGVSVFLLLGCLLGRKGVKGQWQGAALAYALVGGLFLIMQFLHGHAFWQSLAAIAVFLGMQRMVRISDAHFHVADWVHKAIIAAGGAALFFWVTIRVSGMEGDGIEGLRSISWSGLGLLFFLLGLTLKERWYRLMGLTVLGIALLSLVPIIWGFSTEWKIASFFVLGLVFVGLGFVYNRFREKINKLL